MKGSKPLVMVQLSSQVIIVVDFFFIVANRMMCVFLSIVSIHVIKFYCSFEEERKTSIHACVSK